MASFMMHIFDYANNLYVASKTKAVFSLAVPKTDFFLLHSVHHLYTHFLLGLEKIWDRKYGLKKEIHCIFYLLSEVT